MKDLLKSIFFFLLLLTPSTTYASDTKNIYPSIYFGFSNGTNIGGFIGVGAEVKVHDRLSFNLAVGSSIDMGAYEFQDGR